MYETAFKWIKKYVALAQYCLLWWASLVISGRECSHISYLESFTLEILGIRSRISFIQKLQFLFLLFRFVYVQFASDHHFNISYPSLFAQRASFCLREAAADLPLLLAASCSILRSTTSTPLPIVPSEGKPSGRGKKSQAWEVSWLGRMAGVAGEGKGSLE